MDKLIDIDDIFYVLINNVTDVRLLKDIVKLKRSRDLNVERLPLKAVEEILDTYNIEDKDKIINKLIKEG